MLLGKTGKIVPGYKRGWATYGTSAKPALWKDLVGAWAPFLGPTGNTLRDHNGRDNHATINGATWLTRALGFNGSSDYVELNNPASLKPAILTISSLVFLDSTFTESFPKVIDGNNGSYGYQLFFNTTSDDYAFATGDGGVGQVVGSGISTKDIWLYLTGVFDGTDNIIYVNGVERGRVSANPIDYSAITTIRIGTRGSDARHWKGKISSVFIWNRALHTSEISWLYRNPFALFEPQVSPVGFIVVPGVGNPWYYYKQQRSGQCGLI